MKIESYLFGFLAVFFVPVTVTYWLLSKDPTGTTALILTFALSAMIGYYLWFTARRMEARPEDRPDAEISEGAGEMGFFSPHSWWPIATAGAATRRGPRADLRRVARPDRLRPAADRRVRLPVRVLPRRQPHARPTPCRPSRPWASRPPARTSSSATDRPHDPDEGRLPHHGAGPRRVPGRVRCPDDDDRAAGRDELGVDGGVLPAAERGRARAPGRPAQRPAGPGVAGLRRGRAAAASGPLGRRRAVARRRRPAGPGGGRRRAAALHQHHAPGRRAGRRGGRRAAAAPRRRHRRRGAGRGCRDRGPARDGLHDGAALLPRAARGARAAGAGAGRRRPGARAPRRLRRALRRGRVAGLPRRLPAGGRPARRAGRAGGGPRLHRARAAAAPGRHGRPAAAHHPTARRGGAGARPGARCGPADAGAAAAAGPVPRGAAGGVGGRRGRSVRGVHGRRRARRRRLRAPRLRLAGPGRARPLLRRDGGAPAAAPRRPGAAHRPRAGRAASGQP